MYAGLAISDEEEQSNRLIYHAMKGLRPNERLAVNLFYLEEYNISEIVGITGWTKSNTKVILHRARKNLHLGLGESKKEF